jgi:Uma2 family endonuclease
MPLGIAGDAPVVIRLREGMQSDEIVLPESEPESEWVRGRALQKVSPKRDHGRVQAELVAAFVSWARGRGEVATEWRFRVQPPGEVRRPLVPDVSYVTLDRLRGLTHEEIQLPALAPNVAIEILSPGDDPRDVASKIDVYLRSGAELVIVVDPKTRTMALHDGALTALRAGDVLRHRALPDFSLDVGELFSLALDWSS